MQHAQRPAGSATGHISRVALLALIFAAGAPAFASAQVYDPLRGYALDGSPIPGQPRAAARAHDYPVRDDGPSEEPNRPRRIAFVSIKHIRRVANREGFRLATEPHRRGRSYVALAENDSGHRFELIFSAANGNLVDQHDLGPVAVASKTAAPAVTQPAATTPAPTPVQTAAAPASSGPVASPDVAAARAEAEKALAAAADAKRALEASAAESRRAQAKLAEAEAAARREAQAREEDTRRQEARAAEQRRNEARLAETKRRALAAAEAKLAQAKATRERADADVKRAEAEAANARAAMAPAEMTGAAPKVADTTTKPSSGTAVGQMTGTAPTAVPAAAMAQGGTTPVVAMQSGGQDAPKALAPAPDKAPDVTDAATGVDATNSSSTGGEHDAEASTGAAPTTDHAKADAPDETPTGSMQQSPPEPYAAPEPDASESH